MSVLSWIVSQVHPHSVRRKPTVSTSSTTQQNVFTVQQIQPQAIFAGAHIDKFEGCTFNINVFCGDQSKIARLNENWFAERSRHKQALLTLQLHFWSLFINCCFNHKLFHWACMKNFCLHSLMKFVQKWDFEQLCISQIETSTSLPPPGEHTPGMWHPHRPGRREFDYQSPPGGGEFELHAQFHVKSLAWRALIGTVVLEDFRGKDCAFEANWLRVLCLIWRYLNFNIFNIGFRLWINQCNKLCV